MDTITEDIMTNATATATHPIDTTRTARIPDLPAAEWHLGSLMTWPVTGGDGGGVIALGEVVVRQGGEPPVHVHAREDEVWYVLTGTILFQRGQERILATAGDAVVLPRGIPHGFALQTPIARILHIYTPAGLEAAFHTLSAPAAVRDLPPIPEGPPDAALFQHVDAVYRAHGVTFLGPPLPVVLEQEAADRVADRWRTSAEDARS